MGYIIQYSCVAAYLLELAAAAGEIHLKYLDESGFSLWAQDHLIKSGIITVIVQDQGSIHRSKIVKERHNYWESKGLYLFHLPSYCSEMNRIENEWERLKEDELAGRIFADG